MDLSFTHRRYNPLIGEWVLVSPHRTKRPWQGQKEEKTDSYKPKFDPNCYLCPGNERAGGKINHNYESTYVFTNDFSALTPDAPEVEFDTNPLFRSDSVKGTCRVICFSPRHDLTLPQMEIKQIVNVIKLWISQTYELGKKYQWVQIFENKGSVMGCSNPHPHGQIWASDSLPNEPYKEDENQKKYFDEKKSFLLLDYLNSELKKDERIIIENEYWVWLVPFWAVWPFETLLLPKNKISSIVDLSEKEVSSLAKILKSALIKYDNLFETSFPYTMGWHGAPFNKEVNEHWQLHAHFYPPLLRSASVKKFMVGYEMLSEAQRDITAEQAAAKLKSMSDIHYNSKSNEDLKY